jgi:hypothetical protein
MLALKVIGGLLVVFGVVDLLGSFGSLDVWADWFGVELTGIVYSYSAYAEIAIGAFVFKMGSSGGETEDADEDAE